MILNDQSDTPIPTEAVSNPTRPQIWGDLAAARNEGGNQEHKFLETYRAYLLLIANRELSPEIRTLIAPSDLVQESLIEAQQSLKDFAGETEEQLLAWLRRILHNNLVDATRKHKRHFSRMVRMEHLENSETNEAGFVDQIHSNDLTPSSDAVVSEEWEMLGQALVRLPEMERQVITLRNFEYLTFFEIGQRLGRDAGTVSRIWYRAVARLQSELEDSSDAERTEL